MALLAQRQCAGLWLQLRQFDSDIVALKPFIIMIVTVDHPIYGVTELNVERVIGICPAKRWILFERVWWELDEEDFQKVAEAWRELYDDNLIFKD